MKGAIFFSGKYGSTEQYANWISKATGLPVFDIKDDRADPAGYDYLVLGSSIIYMKLSMRKWAKENLSKLNGRSKILFSVSGAGPSDKLERWVAKSFPPVLLSQMEHVALGGKLDHSKVNWLIRLILWIGSLINPDPAASKEERYGFDHVDKNSIEPIVKMIHELQASEVSA
ncbi:flavodoxin domain-containing protein [Maribacter halichondriae]|uniref:flavodoxin domain-containing protein n=1 Tax=Maribacter halichondriae TaxID=2980554 RepID=UPI002358AD0A|nr:flavodoxin domain-containing protein [Maribacter sp. Hal144]